MKKKTFAILSALLLLVVSPFHSCKKADEVEKGSVTVLVSKGVSGTPIGGDYTVNIGESLAYSYTLDAGYKKLTVTLDDKEVTPSGTVTVTGNHVLRAYSDDNLEYKLVVTVGAGVTGTPTTGTYYYKQKTEIPYEYVLADGYKNLSVRVNGVDALAKGTITLSKDSSLVVSASVKYSVVGSWNLSESYSDGSAFNVVLTFSGTMTEGTVADSAGGSGTYDYSDDTLDFTLVFPDVTYQYGNGNFTDENTMSGTCKRYQDETAAVAGTWKATRVTTTAWPGITTRSGKGRFHRR